VVRRSRIDIANRQGGKDITKNQGRSLGRITIDMKRNIKRETRERKGSY
jgi:hypothetical protein